MFTVQEMMQRFSRFDRLGQFSLYSRSIESFRLLTFHGLEFVGLLGQNPVAR
jgi:hypothetical protein